jgi:ribose/xylose/arabinose/galactoside ABC-type transport system permease subunit
MTGKLLIVLGTVLIAAGIIINYSDKIPFVGKLPGDISIERENFKFYFPITTSILLSVIVSVIFWLINRYKN